jgi:Zn-dependent peptidase ImmA (M78 family)
MSLTDVEEREANYFAMCLLMPEHFVRDEVAKMGGIDLTDDKPLQKLAAKFRVSVGMMAIRLGQLGFVSDSGPTRSNIS